MRALTRRGEATESVAAPSWVEVDGGALPYLWLGPDGGRPLVVVPGLTDGFGPVSQGRVRAALRDDPRRTLPQRLLLVSYRHPLPHGIGTAELARDVAAVLDRAVGTPVAVAGHSLGGMVAQHLAATRPDLVDRLVLSATMAAADGALRRILRRWDRFVLDSRWRAFYRDAIDASFTGVARVRRRAELRLGPAVAMDDLVERHLALAQACREHDASRSVARVATPTLVLAGARDPLARPARARELAGLLPQARLRVFGGVAHGFPEQVRHRYQRVTTSFLDHA